MDRAHLARLPPPFTANRLAKPVRSRLDRWANAVEITARGRVLRRANELMATSELELVIALQPAERQTANQHV
jgi:hypothetical protein